MSILPRITPQNSNQQWAQVERKLMRRYAKMGGGLFGQIPKGHDRQFFCLDEHTWVWHEEWLDKQGQRHVITTRYDIRPNGILKMQDGQSYQPVSRREARHLYQAAYLYSQKIEADYHGQLQVA